MKTKNVPAALCRWFFGNIPNVIYKFLEGYVSQQKQCLYLHSLCDFWVTNYFPSQLNKSSDFEQGVTVHAL